MQNNILTVYKNNFLEFVFDSFTFHSSFPNPHSSYSPLASLPSSHFPYNPSSCTHDFFLFRGSLSLPRPVCVTMRLEPSLRTYGPQTVLSGNTTKTMTLQDYLSSFYHITEAKVSMLFKFPFLTNLIEYKVCCGNK